jgi:hypothetical protein
MLRRFLNIPLLALALLVPAAAADARVAHFGAADPAGDSLSPKATLHKAEAALDGDGAKGREVTLLLKQLAVKAPALAPGEQRRAARLLARPVPGEQAENEDPYNVPEHNPPLCSAHFCIHWVDSTADAPPAADLNGNGIRDYVETMSAVFEHVYSVENDQLGWRPPKSDGTRGCVAGAVDCAGKTDVYIKEVGAEGIYGYAAPDPEQRKNSQYAYLVMDNDYNAQQFPRYAGDPLQPMQVTAAHEYNHVLQFNYDTAQDTWMFESTATWMEDKVYTDVNDYVQYLTPWAQMSFVPLTQFNSFSSSDPTNVKVYGDTVWNRWIDTRYGQETVRTAWESSLDTSPKSFAPGAYDVALRAAGTDFFQAFSTFAADTAEWRTAGSPFAEGSTFPDMARVSDDRTGRAITLRPDRGGATGGVSHTAYALLDVKLPSPAPPKIRLAGLTQRGTQSALALVGREGDELNGTVSEFLKLLPNGGPGVVELDNPGRFSRITVAIINADATQVGYSQVLGDWVWDKDAQEINARISTDFKAPTVRSRAPRAGARRTSRRAHVTIRFSEPMIKLTTSTVRLIGPGGRKVKAKLALTSGGKKTAANNGADRIVLTPRAKLAKGRRYTIKLSRDLRDMGGNPLKASALSSTFRTKRK